MMGSNCGQGHKVCMGGMFLLLGVFFFLGTTGVLADVTFAKYWPVIIIVMGLHKLACVGMKGACCEGKSDCCKGKEECCKGECKEGKRK
jgi:hypothetical protein